MPKSYLANEPGAMRALMLDFDPYQQTLQRIEAMHRLGHSTNKVELLILGGTWSSYPANYQTWFVRRCFDAMNNAPDDPPDMAPESEEWDRLLHAQQRNEQAAQRNVGLVVETRPDHISETEVIRLRRLGVTRVQLGVQTLNDEISSLNRRGETADDVRHAMRLLRGAGFKIAIHVMPNLLGATVESDLEDFVRFWDDPALRPDEMKLYPTGLLRGTELYEHYERGEYRPYSEAELIDLLMACKRMVPRYCRLNRVMRDIPAPEIADGVTTSNLRQIVQERLKKAGVPCQCIRCREVKRQTVAAEEVAIDLIGYETDHSTELFIQANTPDDRLAGFLRLSLPAETGFIDEIAGAAVIRQVQVYGPAVALDDLANGRAQHQGLGGRLIKRAVAEAQAAGFRRLAVIAAVGTRNYYRRHDFEVGELYMGREI
jgi:elongator complex protein 3